MPAAKIARTGVNDEEGLEEISGCGQFHSRHLGRPFNRRARDRADGGEHHGLADVPGVGAPIILALGITLQAVLTAKWSSLSNFASGR
jgi:hypothetical protein